MGYKFLHVGMPTTKIRPNEVYVEDMKLYMVDPIHTDLNIEYLRFQDGTIFPEIMHTNPHIAYEVDSIEKATKDAEIIVEPIDLGDKIICFAIKDNIIFEFTEMK